MPTYSLSGMGQRENYSFREDLRHPTYTYRVGRKLSYCYYLAKKTINASQVRVPNEWDH